VTGLFLCRFWRACPRSDRQGLLLRHDCCLGATVPEDLTFISGCSCPRRFLATPLHEIILHKLKTTARAGDGRLRFPWFEKRRLGKQVREWTPRPISRKDCRAVM
jgi:hypothetical protein